MTTSLWVHRILIFVPTTFGLLYRWLPGWEFLWLLIQWKDLLSLIGKLNFACWIIPADCIFLRCLIDLSATERLPHNQITLNLDAHWEFAWWLKFLDPYWSSSPDLALLIDASGILGYGIYYGGHWTTPSWPAILRDCLVQWKELYFITLSCLCGDICGQGRRFSSTATISLWWISGPLVQPKTLISCTLITQILQWYNSQFYSPSLPYCRHGQLHCWLFILFADGVVPTAAAAAHLVPVSLECHLAFLQSQAIISWLHLSFILDWYL